MPSRSPSNSRPFHSKKKPPLSIIPHSQLPAAPGNDCSLDLPILDIPYKRDHIICAVDVFEKKNGIFSMKIIHP